MTIHKPNADIWCLCLHDLSGHLCEPVAGNSSTNTLPELPHRSLPNLARVSTASHSFDSQPITTTAPAITRCVFLYWISLPVTRYHWSTTQIYQHRLSNRQHCPYIIACNRNRSKGSHMDRAGMASTSMSPMVSSCSPSLSSPSTSCVHNIHTLVANIFFKTHVRSVATAQTQTHCHDTHDSANHM